MATFDINEVTPEIDSPINDKDLTNTAASKFDSILNAALAKTAALNEYHKQKEEARLRQEAEAEAALLKAREDADPFKKTWIYQADIAMGGDGQFIDKESFKNTLINTAARFVSGGARDAGNTAVNSSAARVGLLESNISPEARAAYNRYINNAQNPEQPMEPGDLELLNSASGLSRSVFDQATQQDNAQGKNLTPTLDQAFKDRLMGALNKRADVAKEEGPAPTYLELIQNSFAQQDQVRKINKATDFSAIVDRSEEKAVENQLSRTIDPTIAKFKDAKEAYNNGSYGKALGSGFSGAFDFAYDLVKTVADNPRAVPAMVAENAAMLVTAATSRTGAGAQVASNTGYGAAAFMKGMENYRNETGQQYPPEDVMQEMAVAAGVIASLEMAGDFVSSSALKGAFKTLGIKPKDADALVKAATTNVAKEASKTGFVNGAKTVAVQTGKNFGVEALTEMGQTYGEGIAEQKEVSPLDLQVAGALGGAGGMGIGGPTSVVKELGKGALARAELLEQEAARQQQDLADFNDAVKTGDASKYLDQEAPTYNPARAAGVLFANSKLEDVAPEIKAQNLESISNIELDVRSELESEQAKLAQATEYTQETLYQKIQEIEEQMVSARSDSVMEPLRQQRADLMARYQSPEFGNPTVIAGIEKSVLDLETNLAKIEAYKVRLEQALESAGVANNTTDRSETITSMDQEIPTSNVADQTGTNQSNSVSPNELLNEDVVGYEQDQQQNLVNSDSVVLNQSMESSPEARVNAVVEDTQAVAQDAPIGLDDGNTVSTDSGVQSTQSTQSTDLTQSSQFTLNPNGEYTNSTQNNISQPDSDFQMQALLAQREQTQEGSAERVAIDQAISELSTTNVVGTDTNIDTTEIADVAEGQLEVFTDEASQPESTSKDAETVSGYRSQNTFKAFFTQSTGAQKGASARPLVKTKDFLTQLASKAITATDFLKGKELFEPQARAVAVFTEMAQKWNSVIQSALAKRNASAFFYKDPLQFLYQPVLDAKGKPTGKFEVDENFKTAISFAAFSTILDLDSKGKTNSAKTINAMLGRDADAPVTDAEYTLLADVGTRDELLRNAAGGIAYEALGLKPNKDAKKDLAPKIKAALGAHVEKLLIELGYIERKKIPFTVFDAMVKKGAVMASTEADSIEQTTPADSTNKAELSFFKLVKKPGDVQTILDSVKMSQNVLDKLFSVEPLVKMPSLEPVSFNQSMAKNSDRAAPKKLVNILKKKNQEPNKLREDLWNIADGFDEAAFLRMAGLQEVSPETTHITKRKSIEAKNDALVREFNYYKELGQLLLSVGDKELSQAFYLQFSIWKNHRVGIDTNGFNPQASKLQRQLSYQPAWESKISLSDSDQMDNFLLRVAEGLGEKTDAMASELMLPKIKDLIAQSGIQEAVELLRQRNMDEISSFTPAQQDIIEAAVKAGKENLHSLNSLMALAHMSQAVKTGAKDFTVLIPAEVDGKVNGSMLATMLFGAASSVSSLFETLNRGGFFQEGSGYNHFNIWKGDGNRDLYENTIANTYKNLQLLIDAKKVSPTKLKSVQAFTGSLVNPETGVVEKDGRKMIKGPTTEIVFGSSITKSVDNMAEKFIESVYGRIEEVASGSTKNMDLATLITELNAVLGAKKFSANTTIQQLLDYSFTASEIAAMKEAFTSTIGQAVNVTIKADFQSFLDKRSSFTSSAGLTYSIYEAAKKVVRDQYIKEQIAAGKIEVSKQAKVPIHDLDEAQTKELEERLKGVYPSLHSLLSLESGQMDAALFMGKTANKISDQGTYSAEVLFGTPVKDTGDARINATAFERVDAKPGVRMAPMSIHSLDSYISHMVQNAMPLLNVHDAVIGGVNSIREAAQKMNAATWDALFKYSPPTQMYESLVRSVEGMFELLENNPSPELIQSLAEAIRTQANQYNKSNPKNKIDPKVFLSTQVALAQAMAASADTMKFTAMGQLAFIDQYTFEGGAYTVTEAQRKDAQAAAKAVPTAVSPEVQRKIDAIQASLFTTAAQAKEDTELDTELDLPVELDSILGFNNAQAFQLLDHAGKDTSLPEKLTAKVKEVFRVMREAKGNMSLAQAMAASLDRASQSEVAQLLVDRFNKIPNMLWGAQGKPLIESDAEWVKFFEKRGNVTGKQLITALRTRIERDGGPKNVRDFNLEMLTRIQGLINPNLTIRYVTNATASEQVIQAANTDSRAWYIATESGVDVIYVLSPDFMHSGIQTETLLHEMLHSAVGRTIQREREALAANPKRISPILTIINDLESLRKQALEFVAQDPALQDKYGAALKDIDELIAWGMTSTSFQQEVLAKIEVQTKANPEAKVSGFKAMLDSLVAILFRKSSKSVQEIQATGLAILITNVSSLFTEAEKSQSNAISQMLNQSQTNPAPDPAFYTTAEVFDELAQTSPAPAGFEAQLRSLLGGIVDKLHGPAGVLHAQMMKSQALSATDIYVKSLMTGKLPFTSRVIASGFKTTQQEEYVIEQVEATVRAAIDRNENTETFAYKELERLFQQARNTLTAADFHKGDWTVATAVEKATAERLRSFLFDLSPVNGDRLDHLSRFAAMGLAHSEVSALLGFSTQTNKAAPQSIAQRLDEFFNRVLAWFYDTSFKTEDGEAANQRLSNLVDTLVGIEAKKRASAMRRKHASLEAIERAFDNGVAKVAQTVESFGQSPVFQNSGSGAVNKVGGVISDVAAGRVNQVLDNMMIFKDTVITNKTGILSETFAYMRGPAAQFAELFRAGKMIETRRKDLIRDTAKMVLAGFANNGANLTMAQKEAISAVYLRADVQSLLADMSLVEIAELLDNSQSLSAKITELEDALAQHPDLQDQFIEQARALGYRMATGQNTTRMVMLNAGNIAKGYGTAAQGRLTQEQAVEMEKILDPLISLYALQYMPSGHKLAAREVLRDELARADGENGIAVVLKMHQFLQKDSKEKLFDGTEALVVKGYTPEVYNPYTEIEIADETAGKTLIMQGYIKVENVVADPNDPNQTQKFLFVRKDAGLPARPSGMVSLSSQDARGSQLLNKNRDSSSFTGKANNAKLAAVNQARLNAQKKGFSGKRFDPTKVKEHFMAPLLNPEGEVVNYRYTMTEASKDSILERKNHFEHLLGVMAGSTFDKVAAPTHNASVIQALYDHFLVDEPGRPASYIEVGPNSADLEMREVYRLLPEQTKKDIQRIWGSEGMKVRNDMLHLAFGYRKYTLSNIFEKDRADRNAAEAIFADSVQYLLASYARVVLGKPNAEAAAYAMKAGYVVRQSEDVWKELVGIVKDAVVIKTGIVLLGNVWSNMTILMMHGMSLPDIAKHHAVAYKAAQRYQEDSEKLYKLQTQLASGLVSGSSNKIEQDILELKNALARNPVTELMAAGLKPSIVQDVSFDEDIYSYKTRFERGVEGLASQLNPTVRKVAEQVYMTKDTPHYQMLSKATQLSDFVARYTLYQHLTTRQQDPMSKKEAIHATAEAFVMYDIALPPALQYLDDMGIVPFTKFFLSIQRVIISLARQHPIRMLAVAAGNNFFDLMPTVVDSSIANRLGNNPFYSGPFRILDAFGETLPVKAGMSLFR